MAIALFFLALFFAAGAAAIAGLIAAALWLVAFVAGPLGWMSAALCGLAALSLAGWLLPRRHAARLPGREVTPHTQPVLFEELRRVARAVGEPLPTQIFLTGEANAFVTEIEDVFGLGGRRVMGLGMPILRALERGELRAIIAHELGHFHGGEQRTSPWILRAGLAMQRTIDRLAALRARVQLLALPLAIACAPFHLLAEAFLHASRTLRRDQERRADEIAVRVAGPRAAIGGLRKAHLAEATHTMYLQHEVEPLLERGVIPPLGEGYSQYLRSSTAERIDDVWMKILDARGPDPRSTHPPLRERLAAAERALPGEPSGARSDDDRAPAIGLIDDPERYETEPIAAARGCRRVSWDESAGVFVADWREKLARARALGARIELLELPHSTLELRVLLRKAGALVSSEPDEQLRDRAARMLGAAMMLAALDEGYELESVPGVDFLARRAALAFRPFEEVRNYLAGELTKEQWRSRCRGLGLARATSTEASKT